MTKNRDSLIIRDLLKTYISWQWRNLLYFSFVRQKLRCKNIIVKFFKATLDYFYLAHLEIRSFYTVGSIGNNGYIWHHCYMHMHMEIAIAKWYLQNVNKHILLLTLIKPVCKAFMNSGFYTHCKHARHSNAALREVVYRRICWRGQKWRVVDGLQNKTCWHGYAFRWPFVRILRTKESSGLWFF